MYNKPSGENCTPYFFIFFQHKSYTKSIYAIQFPCISNFLNKNDLRAKMLLFNSASLVQKISQIFMSAVHSLCYWSPQMLWCTLTIFSLHDRPWTQSCKAQIWPSCAVDRCLTIPLSFLLLSFWTPRRAKASCKNIVRAGCNTSCLWRKRKWIQ